LGQKVHPIGFRLGITKDWQSRWYADKHYTELLQEDLRIRNVISTKYKDDDIARVEIERASNQVTVTVHTSRPGIVIGRGGQRVDETRSLLEQIAGKRVRLNIQEVSQPELDACLVARSIAQQMERRISHRRAMKQAIFRAMERGAQGIKIICAGRVGSSEYARTEKLHEGRVPLHTLRADIDYATATAHTTLGTIGVKVYIYKGDIIPEYEKFNADAAVTVSNKEKPGKKAEGAIVSTKIIESADSADSIGKTEGLVISEEHEGSKDSVSVDGKGKSEVAGSASKSRPKVRTRVKSVSTIPETKVEKEEKPKARGKTKDKSKASLGESLDIGDTVVISDAVISEKGPKESKPKSKAKFKADAEKESGKD
jgi:small subunit ribosomal protein S3